jgi:hypothetical protein
MRETFLSDNVSNVISTSKRKLFIAALAFVIAITIVCAGLMGKSIALVSLGAIAALISSHVAASKKRDVTSYLRGHEGEMLLRDHLHSILDDEYMAFFGVPIAGAGDIDCVVVGPAGLFCIEAKHHNGTILYNESGWKQIKVGRGGTAYTGNLKNPSGQVCKAVITIKDYLIRKDVKTWVNGAIVFTNPAAVLSVEKDLRSVSATLLSEVSTLFKDTHKLGKGKAALIERYLSEIASPDTAPGRSGIVTGQNNQWSTGKTATVRGIREKRVCQM